MFESHKSMEKYNWNQCGIEAFSLDVFTWSGTFFLLLMIEDYWGRQPSKWVLMPHYSKDAAAPLWQLLLHFQYGLLYRPTSLGILGATTSESMGRMLATAPELLRSRAISAFTISGREGWVEAGNTVQVLKMHKGILTMLKGQNLVTLVSPQLPWQWQPVGIGCWGAHFLFG